MSTAALQGRAQPACSPSRVAPGWGTRLRRGWCVALLWCASGVLGLANAQGGASPPSYGPPQRGVEEWLERLQQGATIASYVGTYVVSSSTGAMSSARIWHVCEGPQQYERVDTLSGQPRSTFRRNDQITTIVPHARLVRTEQRDPGGVFPNLLRLDSSDATADHYRAREVGRGRVAGLEADVVELQARDELRFGYRIWSERQTGLVLKMQTLAATGEVLEQAAFSEVRLNLPLDAVKPQFQMPSTEGYRSEHFERERIDPAQGGWSVKGAVAGFQPLACYRRDVAGPGDVLQWLFSDGLATVSLFIERFDPRRHNQAGVSAMGATHAMSRRWPDGSGAWWLTLVGEVPHATLERLVELLVHEDK